MVDEQAETVEVVNLLLRAIEGLAKGARFAHLNAEDIRAWNEGDLRASQLLNRLNVQK